MKATKLGMKKIQIKEVDRATKNFALQPIKCCASGKVNLLLTTALLSQGSFITKDLKNNVVVSLNNKNLIWLCYF